MMVSWSTDQWWLNPNPFCLTLLVCGGAHYGSTSGFLLSIAKPFSVVHPHVIYYALLHLILANLLIIPNHHTKFQGSSSNTFQKSMTNGWMNNPKAICPSNFFKVGGIRQPWGKNLKINWIFIAHIFVQLNVKCKNTFNNTKNLIHFIIFFFLFLTI